MKIITTIVALVIAAFVLYTFVLKGDDQSNQTTISDAATGTAKPIEDSAEKTIEIAPSLISKAAEGADVFILEPGDGSVVNSPVTVKFGVTNMTVTKAGDNQEYSGHHHLLIDQETLPPMNAPLPATDQLIHFGGGQTETTIELSPGKHTLQLLLGNYLHIPHDKPVISKKITITVE